MTTRIINENSDYEDLTYGNKGIGFWGILPPLCLSLFILCVFLFLLITEVCAFTESYITVVLGFLFFGGLAFWFVSNVRYAFQTVQRISINNTEIIIHVYFCKKTIIHASELMAISDFKITRLMSQIDTFPKDEVGFLIQLKNNKYYRVSPNMNEFTNLKVKLLEMVKKA